MPFKFEVNNGDAYEVCECVNNHVFLSERKVIKANTLSLSRVSYSSCSHTGIVTRLAASVNVAVKTGLMKVGFCDAYLSTAAASNVA